MASASCSLPHDSSAMIGTGERRASSAMPSRSQRGSGCSMKSRPYGSSARHRGERGRAIPPLVGVHAQRDTGADRLADASHALHVHAQGMGGRLDLEDAVAERDFLARLFELGLEAADGERPRQRHALAHAAAEQPVDGHAEGAPVEIPERHLHRRAREGVALHASGHLDPERLDARRVAADEPGRDVALEHDLHGLRRLLAPRRAAEARRLAPADETAARLDPHEGEVDRLQRGERHLVRTLDGDVRQPHADVRDRQVGTTQRISRSRDCVL